MIVNDKLNLTMLCDFYELTMSQGYFCIWNCSGKSCSTMGNTFYSIV